jgi:hypothetical protein
MVRRPERPEDGVCVHPGEPFFESLRALVRDRFAKSALQGGVFVDPEAARPYLLHVAALTVVRRADDGPGPRAAEEVLLTRLVALRQDEEGRTEECPIERLLLLKAGAAPAHAAQALLGRAEDLRRMALAHALGRVAAPLAESHRAGILGALSERLDFLARGFDYQDAELAARRAALGEKARLGDARAAAELERVRSRQKEIARRREAVLAAARREPDLVAPGNVAFIAHTLVLPSADPEDRRRHDREVEAIAVRIARAHEEAAGATVVDVSTPALARAADLTDHPGFDLLSRRPGGQERAIEVKGRAGTGDVEVTVNEWAKACNLRERYWLYVVFDCGSSSPRLMRIRDPFGRFFDTAKGGVTIDDRQILALADA